MITLTGLLESRVEGYCAIGDYMMKSIKLEGHRYNNFQIDVMVDIETMAPSAVDCRLYHIDQYGTITGYLLHPMRRIR